ncbi:hypothetical protein BOX15_Mlig007274g2 [Macrostomum lignano]|uniref:Cadherin domain-containing protein n=1 Tax=Macrostomum lignano TaxID=282301 RepID=A0A267FJC2_9PLAT|nr:hypothetical protein BOX15_Mlig007274g2 [Macrostomum lignano]
MSNKSTITLLLTIHLAAVSSISFNIELDEDNGELTSSRSRIFARLSDYVTGPILDTMRFETDQHSSKVAKYFNVDSRTGEMSTLGNGSLDLDRLCQQVEVCCQRQQVCSVRVRVRLIDSANVDGTQSVWANIRLRDLNDNGPQFLHSSYNLTIEEGGQPGENIRLPQAADLDSEEFGVREYTLLEPSAYFQVTQSDLNGRKEPRLTVLKEIDREQTPNFSLVLLAKDGGTPARTGSARIYIRVIDRNDNAPQFAMDRLSVSLSEAAPQGSHVIQMNATDSDEGFNAAIQYSLRDTSVLPGLPGASGNFYINPSTGLVTLRLPLDYEKSRRHVLIIEAVDRAVGGYSGYVTRQETPRTGSATLTVNVIDVNDEPPRIVVSSPNSKDGLSVKENANADTLVAWVTVGDGDGNGASSRHVTCGLTGPGREFFRLASRQHTEERELELRTVRQLDAEQWRELRLAITCTDAGDPPLTTEKELKVRIINVNDNRPTFGIRTLNLTIPENRGGHLFVFGFNATDRDGDRVEYTLEETPDRFYFQMNSSGRLYAVNSFDREQASRYHLRVTARDTGSPSLESDPLDVVVNIADVNDNKPVFRDVADPSVGLRFVVDEERERDTFVGEVRADDADVGANGRVRYSIAEYSQQQWFAVHPETGAIKTLRQLDRETQDRYTFSVLASDGGRPRQSTSVQVHVQVNDINDNAPRFIYPGADNTTVETSFRNSVGTTVAEIRVMDPDEGQNSVIEHAIAGGSGMSMFKVDPKSGNLLLDRSLSRAHIGSYDLLLQVSDCGYPSQTSTATLIVQVKDLPADKRHHQIESSDPSSPNSGQFPPTSTRRRNNHGVANGSTTIVQRNVVLIICLVIMASLLAFVFLAIIAWLKRKQRADHGGGGGGGGGRADVIPGGDVGGLDGDTQPFKHYPTLPLARTGDALKYTGGGGAVGADVNTYYRIPNSDENYEKSYLTSALRHQQTQQRVNPDLSPSGLYQTSSEQLQQIHGYQLLQQQQQQQQAQSLTSSPCAVDRIGRTAKRQSQQKQPSSKSFNLVTSSFV